jgi:multiple sugar transport system permease protein
VIPSGKIGKRLVPTLFLLPALLVVVAVLVFPVVDTVRLSLFDASFISPGLEAPFTGLGNYVDALTDGLFWESLLITLQWAFGSVILQFLFGLYLALLFKAKSDRSDRGQLVIKVLRSLFLIPWMIPGSLAAIIWKWMYHGSIGVINVIFMSLGLIDHTQPWLSDGSTVLWSCLVVNVWRGTPFFMVMLLGGLQTVPKDLYEAATIDGASKPNAFLHVTLPHLRPLIVTLLIFGFMGAFNYLDIILVLTRGGPANHSMILPLYSWMAAFFENRVGYSAAISVLMCVVLAVYGAGVQAVRRADE